MPHVYQKTGTEDLLNHGRYALFADPGTGKTSIVLNAFSELLANEVATKMLVIAPRRVCQLVWWQESREWTQFRHLDFAWLHNSRAPWDLGGKIRDKNKELEKDADIYLMNPEGVAWLYKKFYDDQRKRLIGQPPWDTVTVDELTKFKNSRSNRSKQFRKILADTPRLWGLTGSPTPNGYEDLFGQLLLLDGGNALGRWYTNFRDKYFEADGFTGFKYKLKGGSAKRIETKIAPLVLRIDANDWLDMPALIDDPIMIKLDTKSRAAYDKLKKEMLLEVDEGVITAANSAALYSKLAQLANGAVYLEREFGAKREVLHVHDAKLEALDDLVDQLGGQPLLLGYEFNHDLDRLKVWYEKRFGQPLPNLGKGTTDREVARIEAAWNNGEITVLACHPASTGHGLNFQKGNANHICWFSANWDFELYDQFIKRILRQGNESIHVINHLLLVEDSIDILKFEALSDKDLTQARFLQAINTAFSDTPAAGVPAVNAQETHMVQKLGLKGTGKKMPKGWGNKADDAGKGAVNTEVDDAVAAAEAAAAVAAEAVEAAQREAVEAKLRGGAEAKSAFSAETQEKMDDNSAADDTDKVTEKPKTTRKPRKTVQSVEAPPAIIRSISVTIKFDEDGDLAPPEIHANARGDFDEDEAVRITELAIAAYKRLLDEFTGDGDEGDE